MDKRILDLYDDFVHVHFDRRLFLEHASKIVGSTVAAAALLPLLKSNYARAAVIPENDRTIIAQHITFRGATGDVRAYLTSPITGGNYGGVIVVHQNRGLNPHLEDIARRLAKDGFIGLAVDFLSPLGGTPKDEDLAMQMFTRLDMMGVRQNAVAAADFLRHRADGNGKVGIVGFCWGGGIVNLLAVADPQLNAGSAFYGIPPDLAEVPKIKAALLLNYADPRLDMRIGQTIPGYEAALKRANIPYDLYYYEGANHAFNDDTGRAYNPAAAKAAWQRTIELFKSKLN